MFPAARTFMCYQDGIQPNGQIIPSNPACAAAVASTGTTPLYNWFAVLRSDGAGRTVGFVPDGRICDGGPGGPFDFSAYTAARDDWPITHLTSGANITFRYSNWAAHPGAFNLYITRQGWSPTTPLAWADLSAFASVTNPPQTGPPGTFNYYFWNAQLPTGRTGRAIIFIHWVRSDSNENFYSCSDVTFDGGNGEVTGIGSGGTQPPPTGSPSQPPSATSTSGQPPSSTTSSRPPSSTTSSRPPSSTTSSSSQPPNGACSATFRLVNSWNTGFQGEVTVRAGTAAVNGWTVGWTNPSGQAITQIWNASLTTSGQQSTAKNV